MRPKSRLSDTGIFDGIFQSEKKETKSQRKTMPEISRHCMASHFTTHVRVSRASSLPS